MPRALHRVDAGHPIPIVSGIHSRSKYESIMRELRPQIYDVLQRVDPSIELRKPTAVRTLKNATAVSVVVIVAQKDVWERVDS